MWNRCLLKLLSALLVILAFRALPLRAQLPCETLLLVNVARQEGLDVANRYQELRRIPDSQVVYLRSPTLSHPSASIPFHQFRKEILHPVQGGIRSKWKLKSPPVLLLAPGFPYRVKKQELPPVSITALLQSRGWFPSAQHVKSGTWISPWYAGPDRNGKQNIPSASLPFPQTPQAVSPSMSIGVLQHGQNAQSIFEQLRHSAAADGSAPDAPIAFLTNRNVRSRCRDWQYPQAVERLRTLGVSASILSHESELPAKVGGIMMGSENVPATLLQATAVTAGAFCEHLTSFAAAFDAPKQSKLTTWLQHGAAASSGTVAEPFAIWTKFVNARVFEHLRMGCTMLEAISLATASPMQHLPVGDALASPWGQTLTFSLTETEGRLTLSPSMPGVRFLLYRDGRFLTQAPPPWTLEHDAETVGSEVLYQVYAKSSDRVARRGYQEITLKGIGEPSFDLSAIDPFHGVSRIEEEEIRWNLSTTVPMKTISLWKGELLIQTIHPDREACTMGIPASSLGLGPSFLQFSGTLPDGARRVSKRFRVELRQMP